MCRLPVTTNWELPSWQTQRILEWPRLAGPSATPTRSIGTLWPPESPGDTSNSRIISPLVFLLLPSAPVSNKDNELVAALPRASLSLHALFPRAGGYARMLSTFFYCFEKKKKFTTTETRVKTYGSYIRNATTKEEFWLEMKIRSCLRRIIEAKYRWGSFLAPRRTAYSVRLFNVRTVDESYWFIDWFVKRLGGSVD